MLVHARDSSVSPVAVACPEVAMIPHSLDHLLSRQRTLMLQGPMGDFFARLAQTLRSNGQQVWKVNFNGGDDLYYSGTDVLRFHQPTAFFTEWFNALLDDLQPDTVVLFGQSRPLHALAIPLARARGLAVFVFEEGYVRPDYVTLEQGGVNAASTLPRNAAFYRARLPETLPAPQPTHQTFGQVAQVAIRYALACRAERRTYPHYRHHREIDTAAEGLRWVRGWARKWWHRWRERADTEFLAAPEQHKRFFLAPLQVWNDSQIVVHSRYGEMGDFIDEVLSSFSLHAPADTLLVFKHHPLDRPYSDYTRSIARRAAEFGVADRVRYIHDQHLPTLLRHALGVVTVNSTTGLQALFHGTPVITLGDAVYDIEDLVFDGELDEFWKNPGTVDAELFQAFRNHLVTETQLNASFYADTPGLPTYAMSSSTALSRRLEATAPIPRPRPQSAA